MSSLKRPQFTTSNHLFGVNIISREEGTCFQVFIEDDGVWNAQFQACTSHIDDLIKALQNAKRLLEAKGKKQTFGYKLASNFARKKTNQIFEGQ